MKMKSKKSIIKKIKKIKKKLRLRYSSKKGGSSSNISDISLTGFILPGPIPDTLIEIIEDKPDEYVISINGRIITKKKPALIVENGLKKLFNNFGQSLENENGVENITDDEINNIGQQNDIDGYTEYVSDDQFILFNKLIEDTFQKIIHDIGENCNLFIYLGEFNKGVVSHGLKNIKEYSRNFVQYRINCLNNLIDLKNEGQNVCLIYISQDDSDLSYLSNLEVLDIPVYNIKCKIPPYSTKESINTYMNNRYENLCQLLEKKSNDVFIPTNGGYGSPSHGVLTHAISHSRNQINIFIEEKNNMKKRYIYQKKNLNIDNASDLIPSLYHYCNVFLENGNKIFLINGYYFDSNVFFTKPNVTEQSSENIICIFKLLHCDNKYLSKCRYLIKFIKDMYDAYPHQFYYNMDNDTLFRTNPHVKCRNTTKKWLEMLQKVCIF